MAVLATTYQSVGEETSRGVYQVSEAGNNAISLGDSENNQGQANNNHGYDSYYFDDGKPEFEFSKSLDSQEVSAGDQDHENCCADPGGDLREPILDKSSDHAQLYHGDQNVVCPVIPPRDEASPGTPVAAGVVAEGTGFRIIGTHFAQGPHNQENDESTNQVGKEDGRTGQLYGLSRSVEEACPYGSAQGNQLNVTVLQVGMQVPALLHWQDGRLLGRSLCFFFWVLSFRIFHYADLLS